MEKHYVKIRALHHVTHDVVQFRTDKPLDYSFIPGQATEVSINKPPWQDEKRPFTFTSLPDDDFLEFTTKVYPEHNGVTNQLLNCRADEELIIHDVWGTIAYKGEGVFIAGGAGVTPFISIFKQLSKENKIENNKLIFSNKTKADIILEEYFKTILGNNFINILSEEKTQEYSFGRITKEFLAEHITSINQKFYICGPEPMMDVVEEQLKSLQVDPTSIIKEQF
jgi:ferredoxin-NADP reductase